MRYLILLVVFLTTYSSSVCNSTLDLGGKSIVNLGLAIDDTSAVPVGMLDDFYPTAGHSYYLKRYLSPRSISTMNANDAYKYCFSLKNSDITKTANGLYYMMDPSITSSNIYNRGNPGDGWKLISTTDMVQLSEQALEVGGFGYTLVSMYGKLNTNFETTNSDKNYYQVNDPISFSSKNDTEYVTVHSFNVWQTGRNGNNYAMGRGNHTDEVYLNTRLSVRCSK